MMSETNRLRSSFAVCLDSRGRAFAGLGILLIVLNAGHGTARAGVFTWTGEFDPDPDNFALAPNWTPSGGPPNDNADVAIFQAVPSGAYTVKWADHMTNKRIEVHAGDVRLTCGATFSRTYTLDSAPFNSAVIGFEAGPFTQLTVVQGTCSSASIESNGALLVGFRAGSDGKLVLLNFIWTSTAATVVGHEGTGEVKVGWLSSLTNTDGVIASETGSHGTVMTEAGGGLWTNHGSLTIGNKGDGTLEINSNGSVAVDVDGFIAKLRSSIGAVTVSGIDASWYNTGSLYVGGSDTAAGGTATLTVDTNGVATVVHDLMLYAGNTVTLDGGVISAGTLSGAANVLNWISGELHITGRGGFTVGIDQPLDTNLQLGAGQTLTVDGELRVGPAFGATMSVLTGGTIVSASGVIGSTAKGSIPTSVVLDGNGTTWQVAVDLEVRGLTDADLVIGGGAIVSNRNAFVAQLIDTHGDVDISGTDTRWDNAGAAYLGGDAVLAGGTGDLRVSNGGEMHVADTLTVWHQYYVDVSGGGAVTASNLELHGGLAIDSGTVEILGGTVNIIDADAMLEGAIDIQGSAMGITGGGQFYGTVLGDGNTLVTLQDADSLWWTEASLDVGTTTVGENRLASLTVGPGALVTVEGTVTLLTPGALALNGGTINAPEFDLGGADFQGWGALNGRVLGGGAVITATDELTMGDATHPLGFNHAGGLQVGMNMVTLNSAGFARSGALTTIQGDGILAAPNGLLLDNGDSLIGSGTVIAPIAAGFGSRISVNEDELHLGDPTALDGFFSDGVLEIGGQSVTLHDANAAVLGSLTTLGAGDFSGSLVAANGAVLEFGKNLTGNGIVDTPDDPTTPLINNGAIVGDSPGRPVVLSGYVKGVGTLDNVTITGTDAPGFSTARVYRGNVTYGGTLEIEIGGLDPGSQHDQINHSGQAGLGGELRIERLGGFEPDVGDRFIILTFATRTGQFTTLTGQGDCSGPVFQVEYNETDVTLVAAESLVADSDVDGDVDLVDHSTLRTCMTGPTGIVAPECLCSDVDQNGTVDLRDVARLQTAFTGE